MENAEKSLIYEAVSASPNIVTPAFNPDGRLERKTHQVWINDKQDRIFMFRDSTSVPGFFSKDIYQLSSRKFLMKDKKKYDTLPEFPAGAFEHFLLDEKYLLELAANLNLK